MATYDHTTDSLEFFDWPDCPIYLNVKLSELLDDPNLADGARVKCTVDVPIDYSEGSLIRKTFVDQYHLRGFNLEESAEIREALAETEVDEDIVEVKSTSTNEMVCEMLTGIETEHIDNDMLVNIYQNLQTKQADD